MNATIQQQTSQIEATRLQVQTVQVDCENLRHQISALRSREPTLGLAGLKERRHELEEENRRMHEHVAENQRLREVLAQKEADLSAKRLADGLPEEIPRPGSARPRSSCGPASASSAAEAVLELSGRLQNEADSLSASHGMSAGSMETKKELTAADLRFRNHLLRRELERTKEHIGQVQADSCAVMLGQELVGADSTAPFKRQGQHGWWMVGQEASEASEPQLRRPRTAAPKSVAKEFANDFTDLDVLLDRNAKNLKQFTGQLRETEVAMGQQRPMTTGHLQRRGQ